MGLSSELLMCYGKLGGSRKELDKLEIMLSFTQSIYPINEVEHNTITYQHTIHFATILDKGTQT